MSGPPTPPPAPLSPAHRSALVDESGIGGAVVDARGYWTATRAVQLERLGFAASQRRVPALVLPIHGPTGDLALYQVRPDAPRVGTNGKPVKYETPRGARMALDVPRPCRPRIGDPKAPLFVTEGVKKGDALATEGLCAVALVGVWNFRGTNEHGGKVLLPEWESVALNGREVFVVYDSDVVVKPAVHASLARLVPLLRRRGAAVRVVYLPPGDGGAKQGVDDFLVALRRRGLADRDARLRELLRWAEDDVRPHPRAAGAGGSGGDAGEDEEDGGDDPDAAGPYRSTPAGIFHRRPVGDRFVDERLTNFTARIEAEVVHDDGAEATQHLRVAVARGERRRVVTVPGAQFAAMHWPTLALGPGALVLAGQSKRDHARAAVQWLSDKAHRGAIPVERRYLHTGWRELDGRMYFLTASGGIGEEGLRPDLAAHLSGSLAGFALPEPPAGPALAEAVRASLAAADLAPDRVTVPVLGAAYRAVLGPCDVSVFLVGRTQVGKSEVAARAQQHFGQAMDARRLPANWSSTENALEGLLFAAKDALAVVDDFNPAGDAVGVGRWHAKADRVLRAQGNPQGRQRMRVDGSLRPETPPRGVALATGEDTPRGESLRARLLVAEVTVGDVDPSRLSRCQADGAAGRYAAATAAFLHWLAPRIQELERDLPALVARIRDGWAGRDGRAGGKGVAVTHLSRLPGNVAQVAAGWHVWLDFCADAGALSPDEVSSWRARVGRALGELAAAQPEHQAASDPAPRYLRLVGQAIAAQRAHLAGVDDEVPAEPERWGWRPQVFGSGEHERTEWRPQGQRVGYVETDAAGDAHVYLLPEPAFAAASALARETGEPIAVAEATLRRRLRERGLLASTDPDRGRITVRRMVRGARHDLLHVAAASLQADAPAQLDQPAQDGHNPAGAVREEAGIGPVRWDGFGRGGFKPNHPNQPNPAESERKPDPVGAVGPVGPVRRAGEGGAGSNAGANGPAPLAQVPVERGVALDRALFQELLDAGVPRAEAFDRARTAPPAPAAEPDRPTAGAAGGRVRRVL